MKLLTCLLLLTAITICQQWYMPDSHLISDKEFVDLVTNDRSCFKFVKYFTPHCPYCRYLKVVFDTLKHQKEWCFNIYELNCQWYPQFCMSNVKSTSFPYTVIYDQNGNVFEEIHGFYPENIISAIFSRIEDECLKVKNPSGSQQNQPVQSQNVQSSLSAQPHVEPIVYQDPGNDQGQILTPAEGQVINSNSGLQQAQINQPQTQQQSQPQPTQPQPSQSQPSQQPISAQPQIPVQQVAKQEQSVSQAQEAATSHEGSKSKQQTSSVPSYFSYMFYGVCIIVASIYVRSLHHQEQPHISPGPQQPEAAEDKSKEHIKPNEETVQKDDEDSELLDIPDDQL